MQKGIRSFKKILQEHWGLGGTSSVSSISTRPDRGTLGAVVKECGPIYREAIFIAVTDLILDILLSGDSLSMDANIDILISAIARQLEIVEVVDMNKMEITKSTASSLDSLPLLTLLSSEPCQRVFNSAEELIALIGTMMLHEVWLQPPLVDGKALKEVFACLH